MTELKVIDQKLPIININFDEVEKELQRLLTFYQGLAVTEDTIKEAKEVQKKLAKLTKDLDRRRIDIKKEMSAPITAFEARCKKLTKMVEEVNTPIKEGLQVFEERRREEKREQVQAYLVYAIESNQLAPEFSRMLTVDEKYLNVTTSMKSIRDDIDSKAAGLLKSQEAVKRAKEAITAHVQQMNDLLELAQPITPEEFTRIHDEDSDLPATLAEITRRAKGRKAAEVAAVERQKAAEVAAVERQKAAEVAAVEKAKEADRLRQEAADALGVPAPEPFTHEQIAKEFNLPDGSQFEAFVQSYTPEPTPRPRLEELKRRSAEATSYTLTIKVPGTQLEELENYLTDNLIQVLSKTPN